MARIMRLAYLAVSSVSGRINWVVGFPTVIIFVACDLKFFTGGLVQNVNLAAGYPRLMSGANQFSQLNVNGFIAFLVGVSAAVRIASIASSIKVANGLGSVKVFMGVTKFQTIVLNDVIQRLISRTISRHVYDALQR
jgi:hypothetical protein